MNEVVIVDGIRTPFGKLGGTLKNIKAIELGSMIIENLINRNQLHLEEVTEVIMGHVMPTDGMTPTRQAVLKAGLPITTRSLTVDRACCSAMSSIGLLRQSILIDTNIIGIAGGMENMSQTPYMLPQLRWGNRLGDIKLQDPLVLRNEYLNEPRVIYTGQSALEHGVTREIQDEWAYRSQKRWDQAYKNGYFKDEVISISVEEHGESVEFNKDEHPRPSTTLEKLKKLPTVYGSPTVTPGNASGINDGAAGVLLMSREKAIKRNLEPIATIIDYISISGDPRISTTLPGEAIIKILDKNGISLSEINLIEINEAYAAMPAVSTKIISERYNVDWNKLAEITNVNGGAISIGHPVGASGARITMTLAYELKRRGGGIGVASICGGIGQADALLIKTN